MANGWLNAVFERSKSKGSARLVLLSLADRARENGFCYASNQDIGRRANIRPRDVSRELAKLVAMGEIRVIPGGGRGKSNEFFITINTREVRENEPIKTPAYCDQNTRKSDINTREVRDQPLLTVNEPLREITPLPPLELQAMKWSEAQIESVYREYPRKVAKGAALKAIRSALSRIAKRTDLDDPVGWLVERVKAYAKARENEDRDYTPYPATWFNQERYDDDPKEWKRSTTGKAGSNGKPGPGRIPSSEANKLRDSKLVEKCRERNREIDRILASRRADMQTPDADGRSQVG